MIEYIDRKTGAVCAEKVYGEKYLSLLYGRGPFSNILSWTLLPLVARFSWPSWFYGWRMKRPSSRAKIAPFIEEYGIDTSEFQTTEFASFNDFFIRKLRPECRPIAKGIALPADGRYLVYPKFDRFFVKGQEFSLGSFLQNGAYGRRFEEGSMVIARLCPTDYHRFHFPCDGVALKPHLINGVLYSVNPLALKKRISILSENKRVVTEIESKEFGTILYVEIGATSVGSIRQTFRPNQAVKKGDEKGYFEFGGSCIVLLFEKGRVKFDPDLVENTHRGYETLCRFGESLGT
jgi:phosphatidylserine decarboxylase